MGALSLSGSAYDCVENDFAYCSEEEQTHLAQTKVGDMCVHCCDAWRAAGCPGTLSTGTAISSTEMGCTACPGDVCPPGCTASSGEQLLQGKTRNSIEQKTDDLIALMAETSRGKSDATNSWACG